MGLRFRLLQALVVLALPVALLAASLRITTHHWLIRWEYGKTDFPADPFGLTTEQRLQLAEVCVDYLVTGAGIELLADLEIEEQPAFNERELKHMVDVKQALWWLLRAGAAAGLVAVAGTAVLAARSPLRARAALLGGSGLTLALLVAVGGLMLTQWNLFFTAFHQLFFAAGTWTFPYSDTLIRLFPERFWMDVGMVIVALLVGMAAAIGGLGLLLLRPRSTG